MRRVEHEEGSTIIFALMVIAIMSALGASLLLSTHVDLSSSRVYNDWTTGILDASAGVDEAVWRLSLKPGSDPPPFGSTVTVNSLTDYDASILLDPDNVLSNNTDDDGDDLVDEADEINLVWQWQVRILLSAIDPAPGPPYELIDTDIAAGPDFGSRQALPTIQDRSGWKTYTTAAADDPDVLLLRYKLDSDLNPPDPDLDGVAQVVFYDQDLTTNLVDDATCVIGFGGDGDPANDTPYNMTYVGLTTVPATGAPVILVRSVAQVRRGNRVSRRIVEAEVIQEVDRMLDHALCACNDLTVTGATWIDSYRSTEGPYGVGPIGDDGSVGANRDVTIGGPSVVNGHAFATEDIIFVGSGGTVTGDAYAGATIGGPGKVILGTERAGIVPYPLPCDCDEYDVVTEVDLRKAANDNATGILPNNVNPYTYGTKSILGSQNIYAWGKVLLLDGEETILLTGGDYYFEAITITGNAVVQVGRDLVGADGVVDAAPDKPVRIYLSGGMNVVARGFENAGLPRDLQIYASTAPAPELIFGEASEFRGVIYAPYTSVRILGSNVIDGAIVALNIEKLGTGAVHYDEDTRNIVINREPARIVAWREVRN